MEAQSPLIPAAPLSDQAVIRVRELRKRFGDLVVLDGVDLEVHEGENLVVLGRSGTGKSVLIKCMVGLLTADSGEIEVLGEDVTRLNRREMDQMRQRIGFSFQGSALYDSMSVRENLEFPLRRNRRDMTKAEIDEAVEEALTNVGLINAIDLFPAELSGGMKKRVGVARTLILNPSIMLYDEPTAGLDPITSHEINELIVQVQHQYHTTAIIITHDITCARMTSNRIAALIDGRCDVQGTFEEVKATNHPALAPFFDY